MDCVYMLWTGFLVSVVVMIRKTAMRMTISANASAPYLDSRVSLRFFIKASENYGKIRYISILPQDLLLGKLFLCGDYPGGWFWQDFPFHREQKRAILVPRPLATEGR